MRLEATALTLGQPNDPAEFDRRPCIDLAKTGDKIELNELTLEGRDGALVTASGLLSQQKAHIDAKIMAPRASGLAALLDKVAPGQAADSVHARGGLLTPIDLTLSADAAQHDSAFAVTAVAAKGAIGGTSIEATVKEDPEQAGTMSISALAQATDSLPLLRLLGLDPTSAKAPGAARIEIKAQGPLGGAAQTAIKGALGPASLDFQGEVVTDLTQPSARGAFRFSTPDAAPMLRTSGVVFPDFTAKLPATAAGDILWSKTALGFANLKAEIAGTSFAGALDYGKQAPGRLTGSIAVDQLPVLTLFGLLLGPPEPAKAGSLWSSLTFAPAALDLPDASIALTIGDSALPAPAFPRGASAKDARAVLQTGPGLLDLRDLSCDIGGARFTGEIKLRRAAGDVSLESHLDFADLALDGPAFRGRMSGALDLAGTGKGADALAASLAGSGRALVSDLTIPRADPSAVARVFAAFDQDDDKLGAGAVAAALASELKRADFKIKSGAFDVSVAAGQLHLAPSTPLGAPGAVLSASFDLRRAILTQRLSLALSPTPKGFSGPVPQIALLFRRASFQPLAGDRRRPARQCAGGARDPARKRSHRILRIRYSRAGCLYQRLQSERRREAERLKAQAEAAAAAAQKAPNSAD